MGKIHLQAQVCLPAVRGIGLLPGKGQTTPMSCSAETSSGHGQHVEVGGNKQRVEPVLIFCQATVWNLLEPKLPFDDAKRMLHLATY